jgi:hypothetical protein
MPNSYEWFVYPTSASSAASIARMRNSQARIASRHRIARLRYGGGTEPTDSAFVCDDYKSLVGQRT